MKMLIKELLNGFGAGNVLRSGTNKYRILKKIKLPNNNAEKMTGIL